MTDAETERCKRLGIKADNRTDALGECLDEIERLRANLERAESLLRQACEALTIEADELDVKASTAIEAYFEEHRR